MKKKYCDQESVFEFVWQNADADGIWNGNAETLATEFGVSEDEAYTALSDLCDKDFIQRVGRRDFIIVRWPEG
jgi:hypothetical protein